MGAASHGFQGVHLPAWEIPLDDSSYLTGLKSIVTELAESDSMVVRRPGGQFILKDGPEAFHVLTVAPLQVRVKRVMEAMKIDEEAARKPIAHSDSSRREFTRRYVQAELEDPVHDDVTVNTGFISYTDAAAIIVRALKPNLDMVWKQAVGK